MGLKTCSKCKCQKDIELFNKNRSTPDGREHYCKPCRKNAYAIWRSNNRDIAVEATRKWRENNPEAAKASARASDKKRAKQPERKIHLDKAIKAWRKKNIDSVNGYTAKRRATTKKAFASWANQDRIKEIYTLAATWNEIWPEDKVHVDHIVPLAGVTVCGLHVENNLQVIRASDNFRKSNRF